MYTNNLDIWIGLLLVANQPNNVVKKKVLHLMKKAHPGTKAGVLSRILKSRLMGKEIVKAVNELDGPDQEIRGFIAEKKDGFIQIVYGGMPVLFPVQIYASDDEDVKRALENEETIMLSCAEALRQKMNVPKLTARVFLFKEAFWSGGNQTVTVVEPPAVGA
jgi:hypothetical protein